MSAEPQVTSSRTSQNSTERMLTRQQADLLPVYDVVGRWLRRQPAFLHKHEPDHHLEELALMTAAAEAVGTSLRAAFERWERWADVQRRSLIVGRPGVTEEDYSTVRACFTVAARR